MSLRSYNFDHLDRECDFGIFGAGVLPIHGQTYRVDWNRNLQRIKIENICIYLCRKYKKKTLEMKLFFFILCKMKKFRTLRCKKSRLIRQKRCNLAVEFCCFGRCGVVFTWKSLSSLFKSRQSHRRRNLQWQRNFLAPMSSRKSFFYYRLRTLIFQFQNRKL